MNKADEPKALALVSQLVDVIWGATDVIEPLIDTLGPLAPEKLSRLNEAVDTLQRLERRVRPPRAG